MDISKKKKTKKAKMSSSNKSSSDQRFSDVFSDPKFRRMPQRDRKVTIDRRFESMFDGKSFQMNYQFDKRGRPLRRDTNADLRDYYALPDDGDDKDKEQSSDSEKAEGVGSDSDSTEDGQEEGDEETQIKLDLARGEGNISTSDDDSTSEWEFEDTEDSVEQKWGELDREAVEAPETTTRLALCNMDWDRIRAVDLLVLFNSFKAHFPADGCVKSVRIYPSDFGLEQMRLEDERGPAVDLGPTDNTARDDDDGVVGEEESDDEDERSSPKQETEEPTREQMERIREYELKRLRYYYAVVECDSIATADALYTHCDGVEYENSAVKIDLRFIPASMEFDERQPKDEATSADVDLQKYRPRLFENAALQLSNSTKVSWDDTDPDRQRLTRNAFQTPLDEQQQDNELKNLIASSSGSSDDEEEVADGQKTTAKDLFRQILGRADPGHAASVDSDDDGGNNMQINWQNDHVSAANEVVLPQQDSDDELVNEQSVENKVSNNTPWEDYLERRNEKRRQRRKEIKEKRLLVKRRREQNDSDDEEDQEAKLERTERLERALHSSSKGDDDGDLSSDGDSSRHYDLKRLISIAKQAPTESTKGKRDSKKTLKKKKLNKSGQPMIEQSQPTVGQSSSFAVDVTDARFGAVFDDPAFNIERSDPHYKPTEQMERLIGEKLRRRRDKKADRDTTADRQTISSPQLVDDVDNLVAAMKRKGRSWKTVQKKK